MALKRRVVFGAASLAAFCVGAANAQSLGEIRLDSSLNQPLSARIAIEGGTNVSVSDVLVSLATPESFAQAGIDRPHFLTSLRFVPVMENGRLTVRVESSQPVREPYLNFLVELRKPNGRMLREYTVLLDPPFYAEGISTTPANVSSGGAVQSRPTDTAQPTRPSAPRSSSVAPASMEPTSNLPDISPVPGAPTYLTVAGDSLWAIAARTRPTETVGIRDSMLAIRALNPDAFINGDLNRLKVGHELILPTAAQLGDQGASIASTQENAVERVAGQSLETAAPSAAELAGEAGEQPVARSASPDPINQPGPGGRLRIEEPPLSAAELANEQLAARLQSLEMRFAELLDELETRNAQIATLQAELEIHSQAQQLPITVDAQSQDESAPAAIARAPGDASSELTEAAAGSVPANPPVATPPEEPAFPNAWWFAFLAAGALSLGLIVARVRSNSRKQDALIEHDELEAAAVTSTATRKSFAPVAPELARSKTVDSLDGAELYVTYGRFAEARAMLDKAIQEDPSRLDLRYKQLRVLAELGDVAAFEVQRQATIDLGGNPERIDGLRNRFPVGRTEDRNVDTVEKVDGLQPILGEEDLDSIYDDQTPAPDTGSQLNLNDFTLDPDWDLIEGLSPAPRKNKDGGAEIIDDDFETSLHEFPEVEELEDDARHFGDERSDSRKT
jgi:pilus assembly protein FimV